MAHVLIIESDRLVAKNIAAMLTLAGHSTFHTADAQMAISAADSRTPDVIVLDLLLAGRSGVELLYELRSYPDWQSIPVLVYSNIRMTDLPAGCSQELGIADFFYKPSTRAKDIRAAVTRLTSIKAT